MNTLHGLQNSGTETHDHLTYGASATPSPEFLREVAELLEMEPEETHAEPEDVGPEGVQEEHIRHEEGSYRWDVLSGRGDLNDLVPVHD